MDIKSFGEEKINHMFEGNKRKKRKKDLTKTILIKTTKRERLSLVVIA